MVKQLNRFPHASPDKILTLPAEAKDILGIAKKHLDKRAFKELEYEFTKANTKFAISPKNEEEGKPVLSEKSIYGGKLAYSSTFLSQEYGVYNPDRITYDIYDKMSKDPTIALALATIAYPIYGLRYRIECINEKQREFLNKCISIIYRQVAEGVMSGVKYGLGVAEKVWAFGPFKAYVNDPLRKKRLVYNEDSFYLKKIKFIHPRTFSMKISRKGDFNGIIQEQPTRNFVPIKAKKLILYSHNPEFGNFFGDSRLKNIYPAWYWALVLTQFVLKYYERRGQPLTIVKAPPGTTTDIKGNKVDNMAHALKIGQGAISNSVVAIPNVFDKVTNNPLWGIEIRSDDQRGEMFIDILNYMDTRKLRGMFIPDRMGLASDGSAHSTNSSSAGDSLDVFIMSEQALINDIERIFNEQIIPELLAVNFQESEIEQAEIKIEDLDYNRKLLIKDVFLRMIMLIGSQSNKGITPKFLPSLKKLAEIANIPIDDFDNIFDTSEMDPIITPPSLDPNVKDLPVDKNPLPTIDKKQIQDKNNKDRATPRKERPSRIRSIREKKK